MSERGILIVVSGFSGAGKGTIMKEIMRRYDNYALSISATTRKPRPGEEEGREYFFKTREEFEQMIAGHELIEWAEYVGNYYGTPKKAVEQQLAEGKDVILEIEIQGALKIKKKFPESLLIFVTVLRECVFDAFEVEASGYLLKPLDPGRFRQAMDRALDLLERRAGASLVVQRGNACEVVPLAEVAYCEVQGRKLYLHRAGGSVLDYYGRLEDLERRVDRRFFKCHRSYLVNLDYVQSFRDGQVLLPREEAIPVSRLRERELIQALLRRMKERGA